MRDAHGRGEGREVVVYQGMALNADERDWLTDPRRGRQVAPSEEPSFGLALLVSTLATNRQVGELEYVAQAPVGRGAAEKTTEGGNVDPLPG
jgi:hypothetical protein